MMLLGRPVRIIAVWCSPLVVRNVCGYSGGYSVDDNGDAHLLNDVWSSADGKKWREESPGSGSGTDDNDIWAPRYGHSTVVYDGSIWLFGGSDNIDDSFDEDELFNDVWSSDDGKVWTKVMDSAGWSGRLAASAAVFTVGNVEKYSSSAVLAPDMMKYIRSMKEIILTISGVIRLGTLPGLWKLRKLHGCRTLEDCSCK